MGRVNEIMITVTNKTFFLTTSFGQWFFCVELYTSRREFVEKMTSSAVIFTNKKIGV